ncbi:uncharacterized protein LOC144010046 [Festucalex cinctus]
MARPPWLSLALLTLASVPALASDCAACNKINKQRPPACLDVCGAASRTARPHVDASQDKRASADLPQGKASAARGGERRRSYPMEHFRWSRPYRNKSREAKRGYAMEHFRWGKAGGGGGNATPGSKPPARNGAKRSAYAVQHFRWGKPAGRKHQAGKTLALPPDAADRMPQGRRSRPQRGSDVGENPPGLLADIFRDILLNDVQRIVG